MDTQKPSLMLNLIALIGSAIVIAILIWGIVHFTGWSVGKISALFNRDDSQTQIDEPREEEEEETPTTPSTNGGQVTSKHGTPDLYVQILRAGMTSASEAYVVFDIANRGTAHTGMWYFTANLPTTGHSQYYVSPAQVSLAPGSHIENTLRFSPLTGGTVTVSVDPQNLVHELNEGNNIASQYIFSNYYTPISYHYYSY